MIKVDHSACLALGGTFDPCYILTLTTLPSEMGPTMNKRNAALIQSFKADILSVPSQMNYIISIPRYRRRLPMNGVGALMRCTMQILRGATQCYDQYAIRYCPR